MISQSFEQNVEIMLDIIWTIINGKYFEKFPSSSKWRLWWKGLCPTVEQKAKMLEILYFVNIIMMDYCYEL